MFEFGLLTLLAGVGFGIRSLLGRLSEPDDEPAHDDFASKQEHMWATTGWGIAVGLVGLGAVLLLIALVA